MRLGNLILSLTLHAAAIGAIWISHRPVVVTEAPIPVEPILFEEVAEEHAPTAEFSEPEVPPPEEPLEEPPDDPPPEPEAQLEAPPPEPETAPQPEPAEEVAEIAQQEERAKVVSAPIALNRLEPKYPRSARRRNIEGSVTVEFSVGPDGAVIAAEIVGSSGDRDLDASALETVRKARFAPATEDGAPVSSTLRLSFDFRLR